LHAVVLVGICNWCPSGTLSKKNPMAFEPHPYGLVTYRLFTSIFSRDFTFISPAGRPGPCYWARTARSGLESSSGFYSLQTVRTGYTFFTIDRARAEGIIFTSWPSFGTLLCASRSPKIVFHTLGIPFPFVSNHPPAIDAVSFHISGFFFEPSSGLITHGFFLDFARSRPIDTVLCDTTACRREAADSKLRLVRAWESCFPFFWRIERRGTALFFSSTSPCVRLHFFFFSDSVGRELVWAPFFYPRFLSKTQCPPYGGFFAPSSCPSSVFRRFFSLRIRE